MRKSSEKNSSTPGYPAIFTSILLMLGSNLGWVLAIPQSTTSTQAPSTSGSNTSPEAPAPPLEFSYTGEKGEGIFKARFQIGNAYSKGTTGIKMVTPYK